MNKQQKPDTISRKLRWKLVSVGTGMLAGLLTRRVIRATYRSVRKNSATPVTPFDLTNPRFSWPDALLWAAAAGVGLGIAKVVSARVAVFGWEAATGTLPPGVVEESADALS